MCTIDDIIQIFIDAPSTSDVYDCYIKINRHRFILNTNIVSGDGVINVKHTNASPGLVILDTTLDQLIFDGNNNSGTVFTSNFSLPAGNKVKARFLNSKVYDIEHLFRDNLNPGTDRVASEDNALLWENIDCYGCFQEGIIVGASTGGETTRPYTFRNVAISNSTTNDWNFQNVNGMTVENCADSDNTLQTGTNNKNSIVPASEYTSVSSASSDFLNKIIGSITPGVYTPGSVNLGQTGKAPFIAGALDIGNNSRPGDDLLYSMGSQEQQYAWSTEDRHIEELGVSMTFDQFWADGDHGQKCITKDTEELVYKNIDATRMHIVATQFRYNGSNSYLDNRFANVYLHNNCDVEDYIRLADKPENYMRLQNDLITFEPNNLAFSIGDQNIFTSYNAFAVGRQSFENWGGPFTICTVGLSGAIQVTNAEEGSAVVRVINGGYFDGDWRYTLDEAFGMYEQVNGEHNFYNNQSGTVDEVFVPTLNMKLAADGGIYMYNLSASSPATAEIYYSVEQDYELFVEL